MDAEEEKGATSTCCPSADRPGAEKHRKQRSLSPTRSVTLMCGMTIAIGDLDQHSSIFSFGLCHTGGYTLRMLVYANRVLQEDDMCYAGRWVDRRLELDS